MYQLHKLTKKCVFHLVGVFFVSKQIFLHWLQWCAFLFCYVKSHIKAEQWFFFFFLCIQESPNAPHPHTDPRPRPRPPSCTEPEAEILSEQSRLITTNLIPLISLGFGFLLPTRTKRAWLCWTFYLAFHFGSRVAKQINECCFYSHFINTFHFYGKLRVQRSVVYAFNCFVFLFTYFSFSKWS